MTAKENFLALINDGKPDALVNEWEPFGSVFDPLMAMTLVAVPGQYVVDPWGVTYYWGEDAPGGSFIPCLTYGAAGSIFQNVDDIVMDEIRKLSPKYFI